MQLFASVGVKTASSTKWQRFGERRVLPTDDGKTLPLWPWIKADGVSATGSSRVYKQNAFCWIMSLYGVWACIWQLRARHVKPREPQQHLDFIFRRGTTSPTPTLIRMAAAGSFLLQGPVECHHNVRENLLSISPRLQPAGSSYRILGSCNLSSDASFGLFGNTSGTRQGDVSTSRLGVSG